MENSICHFFNRRSTDIWSLCNRLLHDRSLATYVVVYKIKFDKISIMKILIISKSYHPEKTIVSKIAEGLYKRGHNVTVLTAKPSFGMGYILPGYQNISYELVNGVKVHRVDVKPRRKSRYSLFRNDRYFYKNSRKWVKKTKEKYDVVYSYCDSLATNLSAGNLYKKLHKVPHIAQLVSIAPDDCLAKRYTLKYTLDVVTLYFLSRHAYKMADELIVSSPLYIDYVKKNLRLKKANVTYIPNLPLIENGIKNPYIYKEGFNIVCYGDVDKMHLLEMVPEAISKVSNPNVYFHLIGNGKLSEDLLEQINALNLGDRVILHGDIPLEDVPNYLENCDACYFSMSNRYYYGRALNNKLIYMMAHRKPIIAIADGDNAEVLKDSGGGLLLNENVDDLVFAIGKAASMDKKELATKANKNYDYYLKHFDLTRTIADIESVLLKKSL